MKNQSELLPERQPTFDPNAKAVAVRDAASLEVAHPPSHELNLQSIADRILTGELTSEKMEMIKGLVAMDAERKFTAAFNALQSELPTIVASSVIPNRGKYERFEDVMRQIAPFLTKHGFTVSFTMDFKENRIIETCHLSHVGGFTRSNSFAVRVGRGDSETQADCKAATTAKRNALLNALNIVIRQDCLDEEHDAGMEGDPNAVVTTEQADELENRVKLTNSNVAAFLKVAGASRFADIPANRYAELDSMLRRKEQSR